jgi:hypothetical protein
MKRVLAIALGVLAVSAGIYAQSNDAEIERALTPAPRNMKDGATVVHWKADGTYDTLKKGTGTLVCYDWSGMPGKQPFAVQCTSVKNLDRVAQNLKIAAVSDQAARKAMVEKMDKDGTRAKPEFGSVWLTINAASKEQGTHVHTTIAVPNATAASMGIPDNNKQGGLWIMAAGTSEAHLMIPGQ